MDNTITFNLEVNGQQAIQTFDNVKKASESVLHTVGEIQKAATDMLPEGGLSTFMENSRTTVENTFNRIRAIDRERESPTLSNYRLESLNAERELLRRSVETTIQDMNEFAKLSAAITRTVGGKGRGRASKLQALTDAMPELLSFATEAARIQQSADALYDSSKFKAQMKLSAVQKGTFDRLGIKADSKIADQILEYAMLRGASQIQRGDFMSRISRGASSQSHIFDSFTNMLPQAFRQFHASKGSLKALAQDASSALTDNEYSIVRSLLTGNPYFAKAAEKAGVAYRTNGMMRLVNRSVINRGMINSIAANLYDTIVGSAKGMPMYGITDVDDPQVWERIARKTNKPFLGAMSASRSVSDLLPWITPTRAKRSKIDPAAFENAGIIDFSPMIKRYEVAKYSLDDLEKGVKLNGRKRNYDERRDDHYFPVDHSMHLESVFRARGKMPENNAAVDDVIYVPLDPRLADPNLPEKERNALYKKYAPYIENGIMLDVGGKQVKYRYTKGSKSLGLEFIPEELYNKILATDRTFFTGGLDPNFKTKDWTEFAKAVEYATKNSTSGENIRDLFGTELPKKLNIAIFDAEESAKGLDKNGELKIGAGMNGASYINKKYVPVGFQARMPAIKTALNTLDPKGVSDIFGGNAVLTGPNGSVVRLTGDEDLILSWGDIKNAEGQRFRDANGNMLPIEEIKNRINDDIQRNGIFASRTMSDANGRAHWLSGQLAQILKGDEKFVEMSTKAFLEEYRNAGTLQGALNSVFADDSETKDLILRTNGAVLGERRIQDRIQEYREQLVSRISRGDIMLPSDLRDQRAMAAPWIFNAISSAMHRINYEGTSQIGENHSGKTFYDNMYEHLDEDQKKTLGLITMGDDEVAFQKTISDALGIARYPGTSQSMRKVTNALVGKSKRAQTLRDAIGKAGLDPNAVFISPSSPVLDMLQDMDFDGDVVELIDLAVTGKDKKSGKNLTSAEVLDRAITLGQERIEEAYKQHKITAEERDARKQRLSDTVFKGYENTGADKDKYFYLKSGMDQMRALGASMQNASYMGAPDATIRRAMQVPGSREVFLALADAESQYSVNSVRGKKGKEMRASDEQIEIMTRYRPFTELFRMVDKVRDDRGNININDLRDAARASDGLEGGKIWATNLPFATMSSNVRSALLSRFFAKRNGVDINKQYNWDYIFDEVLGPRNNDTALGRMQSGLRDVFSGILNAEYLAPSADTIAGLGKLRDEAIKEEMGRVAAERKRLGKAFNKKGSDERIATQYVNRLGGLAIENAQKGLVMDEAALASGDNKAMMDALNMLGIAGVVGTPDLTALLNGTTSPETFNRMVTENSGTTELFRLLQRYNLFSQEQKKAFGNRFSFSSIERFATNPTEFLKTLMYGYTPNTSAAVEVGYASHAAIEHYMNARRTAAENGKVLTSDELAKAQAEAVAIFDEYLGLQQGDRQYLTDKGSIPTRGFSDAERAEARKEGTRLNERYNKARAFIAGGMSDVYPEDKWEVIGIESSNVGNDTLTSGRKMRIHGMGEKLNKPGEEVDFAGAYDILFRNRESGLLAMADVKNYLEGANPENWKKWMVQQATYARQMRDNGMPISEIGIIMPYSNEVRTHQFTEADLNETKNNMSQAVSTIQNALTAGDVTVSSLMEASQMVNELLFGKNSNADTIEKLKKEQRERDAQAQSEGRTTTGTILDALTLHDQYNKAEEIEDKISGFIGSKTRNKDNAPLSSVMWRGQYNAASQIQSIANQFLASGREAEAAVLEARYNELVNKLDLGIGASAQNSEMSYGDALRSSLLGGSGTRGVNSLIEQYKTINKAREDSVSERELLAERIEASKKLHEEQKAEVASLDETLEQNKKEGAFIEKMLGYGASIKETGKPQLKGARTRYFNNSEFASVYGEAFLGKSEDDIEAALIERKNLIEERNKIAQESKNAAKEQEAQTGLLQLAQEQALENANNIAEQNKPIYDQYVKQVEELATKDIEATISGLEQAIGMGGGDGLKQAVESNRLKYVTQAKNGLTDIDSLVKAGILDASTAEGMKTRISNLMSDEALNILDENTAAEYRQAQELIGLQQDTRTNQLLRQGTQTARDPFGLRKDFFARAKSAENQAYTRLENQRIQQQGEINRLETWQRKNADKIGTDEYNRNAKSLRDMKAALEETNQGLTMLDNGGAVAAMAMAQFGQTIDMVVKRLGRQMFHKALQETKRFVIDFNRQMTSIQMITLKTDQQMSTLGDGLIAKAQELKVSISEITASAETLYRQGLSDEEVNERLEVISKFSKVSGTKIDAATKLVTVAMNTGLVTNPEVAADIVTALGDSAATNAAEIEKGIEKAGAAAAADGTTFAQLASMLTAITSTTQVGGNIAGRTLNTIFGRMNKIGTNELIFDENGNAVSGSAVAKLLKTAGVETYSNGQKRSSYDVLYDLSQRWEGLTDAQQQQIAAAVAGTRQYSNFSAIMQGMAEGKVSEYMSLAGESGGIVDEKYAVYAKSLEAALTDVRNAWDALVARLVDNGALTGFLETVTNIINGVNKWTDSLGGLGAALTAVLPILVGYAAVQMGLRTMVANPLAGIGLVAGGALAIGLTTAAAHTSGKNGVSDTANYEEALNNYQKQQSRDTDAINTLTELKNKGTSRTAEENEQYISLINKYATEYGLAGKAADASVYSLEALRKSIEGTGKAANDAADSIAKEAQASKDRTWANSINGDRETLTGSIAENIISGIDTSELSLANKSFNGLWSFDKAAKAYRVNRSTNNFGEHNAALALGRLISSDEDLVKRLFLQGYNTGNIGPEFGFLFKTKNGKTEVDESALSSYYQHLMSGGDANDVDFINGLLKSIDYSSGVDLSEEATNTAIGNAVESKLRDLLTGTDFDNEGVYTALREKAIESINSYFEREGITDPTKGNYQTALNEFWTNTFGTTQYAPDIVESLKEATKYRATTPFENVTFGLSNVGKYGYIYDERGQKYSMDEIRKEEQEMQAEARRAAAQLIIDRNQALKQQYEQDVDEAKSQYYKKKESEHLENVYDTIFDEIQPEFRDKSALDFSSMEALTKSLYDYYGQRKDILQVPAYISRIMEMIDRIKENPFQGVDSLPENLPSLEDYGFTVSVTATIDDIEEFLKTATDIPNEIKEQYDKAIAEIKSKHNKYTAVEGNFFTNLYDNIVTAGYDEWLKKNESAVNQDALVRFLNSNNFGDGASGYANFMHAIENNVAMQEAFGAFAATAEGSRLIRQTSYNALAGTATGPDDIMSQILSLAMGQSLSYGSKVLSTKEKGEIATSAFNDILSGSLLTPEAAEAQKEAERRYLAGLPNVKEQFAFADEVLKSINPDSLSETQRAALQEILGQSLYQDLITTGLSKEQTGLAKKLLSNASSGLSGFTSSQRLSNMTEVAENLDRIASGDYNSKVADTYMDQWANWAEYIDLYSRQNEKGFNQQDRLEVLSQEFETLRKNAEIEIKLEGVKQLEEAGKIAEGTAAALEKMAKGGKAAADAMISLNRAGFTEGQTRAKLYKGTQEQQYEAARSILGMSEEEFYSDIPTNLNAARAYDAAYQQELDKQTIEQMFLNASTPEKQAAARKYAYSKGFTIDTSKGVDFAEAVFNKQNLKVASVNPLLYASQIFTEKEKADALEKIISEDLGYNNNNKDLYNAAYETGGAYTKEYLRRRAQGLEITDDIMRGMANERREQSGLFAEDYDLTTLGGMFAYNQANRAWNNRAAIAAGNAYRSLTGNDIQNVEQLGTAISQNSDDWLKLLESSDELNKKFSDMGVRVGEDGLDFSGVQLQGDAFASALADLVNSVAQASEEFNKISEVLSTGETYDRALLYLSGQGSEEQGFSALSQLGNSQLAQIVRNNWANQIRKGYRVNDAGEILDEGEFRGIWDPYAGLSSSNKSYAETLMSNWGLGINGLTDVQRYSGLMGVVSAINKGTLGGLRAEDRVGMFADYTQGMTGAEQYLSASEALEKEFGPNGLKMADISTLQKGTEEYERFEKAISGVYGSMEDAIYAQETWDKELSAQGIVIANKYGDETAEIAAGFKNLQGSVKAASNQMKTYGQNLASVMNNQFYRNLWKQGDRSKETKNAIASMLGVGENGLDILGDEYINSMLKSLEDADMSQIQTDAKAVSESMSKTLSNAMKTEPIVLDGIGVEVESGGVALNFDEALAALGDQLSAEERAFIEMLRQYKVEGRVVVNDTGEGLETHIEISGLGQGGRSGGGGGGGGKSKADKLLEAQKHRIEAIQHENNMLEIEAEDYARANNVTAYESTVDRQIEGQEKLRAAYRQNIAEIKQMMSNVKEGSDDWYKLVEALYSAEEAYAKVASAIDDLIKKQIQERQQLYEFETANNTHAKNMLDIWGKRYSRFNNYSSMNHNIDEQVANARAQLATDTAWANDLAAKIQDQYDRGNNDTDTVREWRQTLDQLIERIANSTEEIAELEASRLSVIQQQRTNNLQTPEHVSKMYDINREMMTLDNNYSGLINAFDKEYSNVYEQYQIWANSREQSLGLLATQSFDTAEWYNTRSDLYEADEQLRQLELQMKQIQNNKIAEQLNYFTKRSDYESGNRQHNLNMIQSEQNRYQSLNELTNYGHMLEKERDVREENIAAAEEELVLLNKTKDALEEQGLAGTENYLNVIELIKQREELIRSETATIEENTRKLKENQEAILKTRKDLEDTLDAEIKAREEQRKKELSARVSLENIILETIKDRYRDEWRLIQEDINKKREALAKEKALISERLNARKQAAAQQEKYSELEEYERQLAMIVNDPTRSKDVKVFLARIQDLREAISMEEASQEAQAAMQDIDQEMAALAEEETTGSNQLSEMLADANNFSEEVENIINSSWDNISAYLTENNKAFKNSLEDGQQQMLEGWEQTWKNMKGIVDTYWEEINEILTSPESFLAYMMASRTFTNASEIGQELLVIAWQNMMDKYEAAYKSSPEAENYQTDTHPWYEGSGEYGDVDTYSGIGVNGTWGTPENGVNMPVDNGQIIFPEQPTTPASSSNGNGNGNGKGGYYIAQGIVNTETVDENGLVSYDYVLHADKTTRDIAYAVKKVKDKFIKDGFKENQIQIVVRESTTKDKYDEWGVFKQGGLVNYTGPAWVDGTPSKPEAFLNASQTETFKKLADAMTKVSISGGIWPDGDMFGGGDTNYGDIYVTINQAELKDDADFDEVAKKVGKSFVKEMSRNGFNLTKYNL